MQSLLTYRGAVYPWHCDQMGHMNVMWYVGKFDEATWQLFSALGITGTYLRETESGLAAVQQNLTYKKELFAGSIIDIFSQVISIREKVIEFVHDMRDAESGEVTAICEITAVHMNRRIRKAVPFPNRIVETVQSMLELPTTRLDTAK